MLKIGAAIAVIGLVGVAAYAGYSQLGAGRPARPPVAAVSTESAPKLPWVAAALGRVEPKSGEIRIGATLLGRVAEVLVRENDKVEEGQLLMRLDDEEVRARLAAAEAGAASQRQERDAQPATPGRDEIRRAEDALFAAERALTGARFELDYALAARRSGAGSEQAVGDARKRLASARDRLQRDRIAFVTAQSKPNLPSPSRLDSALSAARAEVAVAEALLEKTRIRSPLAANVLQVYAKVGETVAPSPEAPLAVLGDVSALRLKAEVDEGDAARIKVGQKATIRSVSYPDKDFEGTVSRIAPSLAPPRIGLRGPRRATDVEVLEVTIDLANDVALLPGMRADAFFRRD